MLQEPRRRAIGSSLRDEGAGATRLCGSRRSSADCLVRAARAGWLTAPTCAGQVRSISNDLFRLLESREPNDVEYAECVLYPLEPMGSLSPTCFVWQWPLEIEHIEANWACLLVCASAPTCRALLLRRPLGIRLANGPVRRRLRLSRGREVFDLTYFDTWSFGSSMER